jgi:hypothetical protein
MVWDNYEPVGRFRNRIDAKEGGARVELAI